MFNSRILKPPKGVEVSGNTKNFKYFLMARRAEESQTFVEVGPRVSRSFGFGSVISVDTRKSSEASILMVPGIQALEGVITYSHISTGRLFEDNRQKRQRDNNTV